MYQEKSVMSISQIYNNDKQRYVHGAGARSLNKSIKIFKASVESHY